MLSLARYEPDARSELWEEFLSDATEGNADLAGFLQRAAGYSLTDLTSEEKFLIVYGPGARAWTRRRSTRACSSFPGTSGR